MLVLYPAFLATGYLATRNGTVSGRISFTGYAKPDIRLSIKPDILLNKQLVFANRGQKLSSVGKCKCTGTVLQSC